MVPNPTSSGIQKLAIAGLGNYSYPWTRHSIGQIMVEQLAKKATSIAGASGSSNLLLDKSNKKKQYWSTTITVPPPPPPASPPSSTIEELEKLQIHFIRPRALMNISGPNIVHAAQNFFQEWPLPPLRLITLQDDLDMKPLDYKLMYGQGSRGHNGVRSVIQEMKGIDFLRIRIGIGRPQSRDDVAQYVMESISSVEYEACLWDEEKNEGGPVLEGIWAEIMKVGWKSSKDDGKPDASELSLFEGDIKKSNTITDSSYS